MTTYYLRTTGGNWSSASTWSLTSGGGATGSTPTAADDIICNAASSTATLTVDGTSGSPSLCRSFICTGFTGTFVMGSTAQLNVGTSTPGDFVLASGMTMSLTSGALVNFVGTASPAIYTHVSGDGATKTFAIGATPGGNPGTAGAAWTIASVGTGAAPSFTISGSNITFSTAPTAGTNNVNIEVCGNRIDPAGKKLPNVTFNGSGGVWTLINSLITTVNSTITLLAGSLHISYQDTYNAAQAGGGTSGVGIGSSSFSTYTGGNGTYFVTSGSTTRSLQFGQQKVGWWLPDGGGTVWDVQSTTGFTYTVIAATSLSIQYGTMPTNPVTFNGGGVTYTNTTLNTYSGITQTTTINGTNTFAGFIPGGTTILGANQTVTGSFLPQSVTSGGTTVTITIASPGVVTWTGHGFETGNMVSFSSSGSLPTGITAGTTYFVIYNTANSFWLATTLENAVAGIKINTSGTQSGTHTGFAVVPNILYMNGYNLSMGGAVIIPAGFTIFLSGLLTTSSTSGISCAGGIIYHSGSGGQITTTGATGGITIAGGKVTTSYMHTNSQPVSVTGGTLVLNPGAQVFGSTVGLSGTTGSIVYLGLPSAQFGTVYCDNATTEPAAYGVGMDGGMN